MTNRWTLLSERYSVDCVALLVFLAGCRLFCECEKWWEINWDSCKINEIQWRRHWLGVCWMFSITNDPLSHHTELQSEKFLTFPDLLIFFASSIKRWGTIQRLSDCAISTLVKWQHCAAILTCAEMSFLSVGWTKRGGKNEGAVIVATLWIDILLKLWRSTTSLKKLRSSRMVLRFSWGKRRHNMETALDWSWAGSAKREESERLLHENSHVVLWNSLFVW